MEHFISGAAEITPVGRLRPGCELCASINELEIELPTSGSGGYPWLLVNGTVMTKGGARITYFDIDQRNCRRVDAGLAIARIYDGRGEEVTSANQLELGGLDWMCSASLFDPICGVPAGIE